MPHALRRGRAALLSLLLCEASCSAPGANVTLDFGLPLYGTAGQGCDPDRSRPLEGSGSVALYGRRGGGGWVLLRSHAVSGGWGEPDSFTLRLSRAEWFLRVFAIARGDSSCPSNEVYLDMRR